MALWHSTENNTPLEPAGTHSLGAAEDTLTVMDLELCMIRHKLHLAGWMNEWVNEWRYPWVNEVERKKNVLVYNPGILTLEEYRWASEDPRNPELWIQIHVLMCIFLERGSESLDSDSIRVSKIGLSLKVKYHWY